MAPHYGDMVLLLFVSVFVCLFLEPSVGLVQYDRTELFHVRANMPVFLPDLPPDFQPHGERLKHRRRGARGGTLVRLRRRIHRPALPSLILSNVRSLANKKDELTMLIGSQRDFRDAAAICLTETWLNEDIPDSTLQQAGFSLYRADRTTDSLKQRGGGVCCYINRNWCTDTRVLSQSCSPELESLTVECKPFYLPREFSSVTLTVVYIPPSAAAQSAMQQLADNITEVENNNPDTVVFALGDFNHVSLKKALPRYKPQINIATRLERTLDQCYSTIPEAFHAVARAPLGQRHCPAPVLEGGFFVPVDQNIGRPRTYHHGTKINYSCDQGRKPNVKGWWATSTCQNGNWIQTPQCIDVNDCLHPEIPNAESPHRSYRNQERTVIKCDEGYKINEEMETQCRDGNWASLPKCKKDINACAQPAEIPNAVIMHEYQTIFPDQKSVSYKCADGYSVAQGKLNSITCTNGQWEEAECVEVAVPSVPTRSETGHPIIQRDPVPGVSTQPVGTGPFLPIERCGPIPTIANGVSTPEGMSRLYVTYKCVRFYKLEGPEKVNCHANRSWSQTPTCIPNFCWVDTDQTIYLMKGEEQRYPCHGVDRHYMLRCNDYGIEQIEHC